MAGTAGKSGRERLGCGSRIRGENPLHPEGSYRHLRRGIFIYGSLVPGAKTWADAASQKGAFHSLDNAKRCADENAGYSVFDESGKALYTSQAGFAPYLVKVSISDLNIRKGPGTNYAKTGKYTGKGVFTIVEEADGQGASRWGLLKSYQKNRNGWISLDFAERV